ncbi:Polyadenylate-binding protein 2 [Apostasia shenzhenica]|uniref:Polyadenylate-binding protein 2 n=1 Tax=Apostasia shenzhenica TaxID=1088818 RepID=A0A2I0B4S6_9ASPA|nr:Polyadenylate-binding protein 2 [Apostasia shenzhenica]
MSRICVKNLPRYVKEDRLREFFSRKGEVTDAKLMRTKDGKSRQFSFIGFRTEREAEEAISFFNNTYMDTSKITCEIAHKVGDPNTPRPWSRYSGNKNNCKENTKEYSQKSSLAISRGQSSIALAKKLEICGNDDPKLKEFFQIMQPRVKAKIWTNDTIPAMDIEKSSKPGEKETHLDKKKRISSCEAHAQLSDESSKKSELIDASFSVPLSKESSIAMTKLSANVAKDGVISDMDYFKSRVKKNWLDSETYDEDDDDYDGCSSHDADECDNEKYSINANDQIFQSKVAQKLSNEDQHGLERNPDENNENSTSELIGDEKLVLETSRLFVRNLSYTTTEDELLDLFRQFGDVSEIYIVVNKDTKRSKGIGYVLFTLPESALRAMKELDNSIFQGRLLHIMPAKLLRTANEQTWSDTITAEDKKTFKQQREEQKKASEANGDTRAWNSLFMRPDTVVENIARKHGVSKSDFLDREASDLAVRIALGETQVVTETKKALINAGVNVAALEKFVLNKNDNVRRSNHVILVKNLPYGSSEAELVKMFGKFGSLDKIILPPTKTLALVIFLEAAEARAAFKGLAYKRYKDVPLYLEWAPGDILSLCPFERNEPMDVPDQLNVGSVLMEQIAAVLEEIDHDRIESRSVFIKNLNFKTTDESLKEHFSRNMKHASIKSVKVKKHLKNGKNVSMGFGFIEFDSSETAADVCKNLQGTILDGHALILQLCHTKNEDRAPKKDEKDKSSTKLIVRNVAFEATEKDLRQLFSPFGQIKSLRLPMKLGSHRGFAFVEYVTKQEAQNALQSLASTHLYGRHLVLERAKAGESLEELRARTAAQFVDEDSGFQKLSKKRKHLNILDEGTVKFSKLVD